MLTKFLYKAIQKLQRGYDEVPKGRISFPTGSIPLEGAKHTLVMVVGPQYDQHIPNAMMTFRSGYCHAIEELGFPYLIVDHSDLQDILHSLTNPFCMLNGSDFLYMDTNTVRLLRKYPHAVWVDPWFRDSERFFKTHNLNAGIWTWSHEHRNKILESEPTFVHTATVPSGFEFFSEWVQRGARLVYLPLACDTHLYHPKVPTIPEFQGIKIAFVGGYWESKGRQIDQYLRALEKDLVVYGYSPWPYNGYRGQLSRELEPSLYRQATIAPTINEPSVRILHGQINERVFKIIGSGGLTVVDAVPWYRELFTSDELLIPGTVDEFHDIVNTVISDPYSLDHYRLRGFEAVLQRHTYIHRAKTVMKELGLGEMK